MRMTKKVYRVKADRDPEGWMEVEAAHAYHAAAYYCGTCVSRPGVRVDLVPDDMIEIRLDADKVCRATQQRVMAWANWRANEDSRKLAESGKKKPWRDPRAGPES